MVIAGHIKGIFSANIHSRGLPRPAVDSLHMLKDFGIENDRFAGSNVDRSVMIVGMRAYDIAKKHGIELVHGSLGENILLDFDPHDYIDGTIFKIGDAHIQITEACSLCNHLSVFDKRLPSLVLNHRGLYCKVIKGGRVTDNSIVQL